MKISSSSGIFFQFSQRNIDFKNSLGGEMNLKVEQSKRFEEYVAEKF